MTERQARYTTIVATLAGLIICLQLGLLGALLAGLLVHELVHAIAPRISFGEGGATRARVMSVGLIGALVIGALVAAGFGALAFFRSEGASPVVLLARMADILSSTRAALPDWIGQSLPADTDTFGRAIADHRRVEKLIAKMRALSQEVLLRSTTGPPRRSAQNHPKSALC